MPLWVQARVNMIKSIFIHTRPFLLLIMLGLPLTVSACGMGEQTADGYENASIEHTYEHWKEGEKSPIPFAILDVRTPEEYAAGHIPGAMNISIQTLQNRLNEVPKNKRVYVHCEAGGRSAKASKILMEAGITNIENIPAGMRGWRNAGYPIEK